MLDWYLEMLGVNIVTPKLEVCLRQCYCKRQEMLQTRSGSFTALGLGCNWWLFYESSCCIWSGM